MLFDWTFVWTEWWQYCEIRVNISRKTRNEESNFVNLLCYSSCSTTVISYAQQQRVSGVTCGEGSDSWLGSSNLTVKAKNCLEQLGIILRFYILFLAQSLVYHFQTLVALNLGRAAPGRHFYLIKYEMFRLCCLLVYLNCVQKFPWCIVIGTFWTMLYTGRS